MSSKRPRRGASDSSGKPVISRPPPHEQASASSSSIGPIASKAAAQRGSLQKSRALTIIASRMRLHPDGMSGFAQ